MEDPKIFVYLAGPITGATKGQANDWRTAFDSVLKEETDGRIVGVSPLRCEPLMGERYTPEYADPRFGVPQAIQAKNYEDVKRCDISVCYVPKWHLEDAGKVTIGTICELNWAYCNQKPAILISDIDYVRENAVIKAMTPWRFPETKKVEIETTSSYDGLFYDSTRIDEDPSFMDGFFSDTTIVEGGVDKNHGMRQAMDVILGIFSVYAGAGYAQAS